MRIGILGGAFNPPHIGHLVCAQEALLQLELARVLFVPVGDPPHRVLEDDPGGGRRRELLGLAIGDDDRFEVSSAELERSGPSYTADTLRELSESAPEDERFLILGADQASALADWHEPEEVLSLSTVAVVPRVGSSRSGVGMNISRLKGAERVRYLDMPLVRVSSTLVRRRVRAGQPIRYLVPDAVRVSIEENALYAADPEGAAS